MATFADLLTRATASTNSAQAETLRTAFTTFRDSVQDELDAYGLRTIERTSFDEALFELAREVSAKLRSSASGAGSEGAESALLTEAGEVLVDETNAEFLLLEA